MYFPVAEVEMNPITPVLVGAVVSLIMGQVGLTGGIATLPYMMSALNFTSPSVSATNLVFVLMAPLGSVYSYWREKRMLWRLGLLAGAGGVVGATMGPWIRTGPLNDMLRFKAFFGLLLLLIGLKLFFKTYSDVKIGKVERTAGGLKEQSFIFSGTEYTFSPLLISFAGLIVGIVSTTFGIGTGILLVPFYTAVLRLPIYAVASSALLSTLIISFTGTMAYASLNYGVETSPDLRLGVLLGIGGIFGGFASAKAQGKVSSKTLQKILGALLFLWALVYLRQGI
jgi:uncharacterized membrane protein YfcA